MFISAFVACVFGVKPPKLLLRLMSRILLPMISSKNFAVSGHMFKLVIHFKFSVWCKIVVQFHSSAYGCPVFPKPFIEETVFSLVHILGSVVVN